MWRLRKMKDRVNLSQSVSSVTQSCLTFCDPMECSTPGFPVHHQVPELTQTHVHQVGDAIQPSHPVAAFSYPLQSFPASESFQMSQFFASSGQNTGVSASTSVIPMNIQDWFPIGWTGWILTELSQTKTNIIWYHLYMKSKKKKDTNELICKTETDSQTEKANMVTKGKGGRLGS